MGKLGKDGEVSIHADKVECFGQVYGGDEEGSLLVSAIVLQLIDIEDQSIVDLSERNTHCNIGNTIIASFSSLKDT